MDLNFKEENELLFPEYANITEADLEQMRSELRELTEADNKLTIFQRIGFVLDQFAKLLKGSYSFRFKEMNLLNKDLNDMYNKVIDVMENNKEARYKLKEETWKLFPVYLAALIDSKHPDNSYRLMFSQQCYDPEAIQSFTNSVIARANRERDDRAKESCFMEGLVYFQRVIDDYSTWMDRYIPAVLKYEYRNVNIDKALDISKKNMEVFYAAYIYGSKNAIQTDLIYIQCMKKMYESMKLDYASDGKAMKFVNDVFGYVLNVMVKGINYDNEIFGVSQNCFRGYYNSISEMYEHITA